MTVTRFAPSPTGRLHLGHAFSAILNHDLAREHGGRFLLRIEDTDQGRCRPAFEQAIYDDLSWLGLDHDGEVLRQSDRFPLYAQALDQLIADDLLYRCFKTRSELRDLAGAPHGAQTKGPATAPLDPGEEKELLDEGRAFAWRLNSHRVREHFSGRTLGWVEDGREKVLNPADIHDDVLARKDFPASYHLACVFDDAQQGVSLVYRGEDLIASIALHRVLQELLGLPVPDYKHHRLITDEAGRRLAKRDNDKTLETYRLSGETPASIRRQLVIAESD